MRTVKELKIEGEGLGAIRSLTETYEDLAVSRMQDVRHDVLVTRQFLAGVSDVYTIAKGAYIRNLSTITNKREREREMAFIRRNQKTVAVLISGNHSLLGNTVFQAYKVFVDLARKITCDLVILGNIGRYLGQAERPPLTFKFFDFDDYNLEDAHIKPVVEYISQYEKVLVVYPKFVSVLSQVAQIDDISGGVNLTESLKGDGSYFFEPSAREVMKYFEGQIIASLFRQKMLEAMLARYASRLTIMDAASQTIDKFIEMNDRETVTMSRRESNKKLLGSFSGISLWREE